MSDGKKRAHIVTSFKDSGTGESFTAGDTPLIDAGAFANYEAAGLVQVPPAKPARPTTARAAPRAARKPSSGAKASGAPSVPADPPAPAPGAAGAG